MKLRRRTSIGSSKVSATESSDSALDSLACLLAAGAANDVTGTVFVSRRYGTNSIFGIA